MTATAPPVSISDAFDGGNIALQHILVNPKSEEDILVKLRIKPDEFTELEETRHSQYFCFRSTVRNCPRFIKYSITNADETSYAQAWTGSTVFFTDNLAEPDSWKRLLDTTFEEEKGILTWTYKHETAGSVYFSYFPPFSYYRHLDLVSQCARNSNSLVESLGQTLEGREVDCIKVGSGSMIAWIIHRQHPGESMAEFYAEGLLRRLLGLETEGQVDGLVHQLQSMFTFYIIPNMCPDGGFLGHLRTNSIGTNLNREWADVPAENYNAPTLERSPEVYHVLTKMRETGVDLFLDIHGDEFLPFNFLSGAEGTRNWGPRLNALHGAFLASYQRANPDMQQEIGYDPYKRGPRPPANIATNALANEFDCFAATLEMPFKDCLTNPDPVNGWSPFRARMLGASVLEACSYVHAHLRDPESWKDFPEEDMYVKPSPEFDEEDFDAED